MLDKLNIIIHRMNVLFVMILIVFIFQVIFMVQSQKERNINTIELINKIDSLQIRMDSLNQEMIYLNQYLYD